jgi:tRNA nucleotidyltransferase/poly(A) polymerase
MTTQTHRIEMITSWLAQRPEPMWLVGGAVRDALAGRTIHDVDLVVAGDAAAVARQFARAMGGSPATLDHEAGTLRVTLPPSAGEQPYFDFANLRGASIAEDLRARDFTINALAVPLSAPSLLALFPAAAEHPLAGAEAAWGEIIDPTGGLADLAAKHLRLASTAALQDDPLRVLRGARLATVLDLTPDDATLGAAQAVATRLPEVAQERVLAELYAMMAQPHSTRAMTLLDQMGALTVLIPPLIPCRGMQQGLMHYWDVFDHTLAVIDALDHVVALLTAGLTQPAPAGEPDDMGRVEHPTALDLGGHNAEVLARLREPLAEGQTRLTLLKVAALFHDVGKPLTRTVNERGEIYFQGHAEAGVPLTTPVLRGWHMGRVARRFVETVVACHMRPGQMAGPQGLTDRAARHFFRDAGEAGLEVAVFSLADHLAVYGPAPLTRFWLGHYPTVAELVRRVYEEPEKVIPPRLMDGNDLIGRYGLAHGPAIGRILAAVEAAHLDGTIATRAEALALAEQLLREEATHAPSHNR